MESLNQIYNARNPTDVPDFRPAYVYALRLWLILSGFAILSIWIEASLTDTLSDYLSVAVVFFAPAFLATAAYVHFCPANAEKGAVIGFVILSAYFTLAFVFALIVGPWSYSYLIFSNAVWISATSLYTSLFLGKYAFRAGIANACIMSILAIGCLVRFTDTPTDWHGDRNFAIQPYVYSILALWAMFFGGLVVNHLYKSMRESQRKVGMLRGVMTEMVGHEIGTPLQAIFNNIELLQLLQGKLLPTSSDQESLAKSIKVIESLRRSVQQVQSVLDNAAVSMRQNGGTVKETAAVDDVHLLGLLEELIEDFTPRATERNLSIRLIRDHAMPEYVSLDKTRVTQILSNLLSNAIKYSDHGEITVSATAIYRDECQFSVVDSGIGIPSSAIDDIFEPYFRMPEARNRGAKGSGLGLAVVKRELEVLGGHINVQSTPGKGSAFTFSVPGKIHTYAIRRQENVKSLKLLVADDSGTVLAAARQIFEMTDFVCLTAANGGEALKILQHESIDILFLDIQMPIANGFDVANKVRTSPDFLINRHIPIIAMISDELNENQESARFFSHFLKKPFAFNQKIVYRFIPIS